MAITTTDYKHSSMVKMDGRIDSNTSDDLLEAFESVQKRGIYKIVFDMGEVDFLTSKGWWVLIQTQKASKRYNRGEVVLANVPQKVLDSLDLVGMSHYFQIFDDIVSAVGSF